MTEIKPGPELDLAVARALGWEGQIIEGDGELLLDYCEVVDALDKLCAWRDWNPSEDANHALEAAEAFGLCCPDKHDCELGQMLYCGELVWFVCHLHKTIHASTLPLAICAAIIKLSEEVRGDGR